LKKANELEDKNIIVNPIFKHLLKCESCLWKITFYKSTEKVYLSTVRKFGVQYVRKKR
jgi:hypothetical protein